MVITFEKLTVKENISQLSEDIKDLIKVFGTKQKLFQNSCPIYGSGITIIWISETKDIKNPYYGNKNDRECMEL